MSNTVDTQGFEVQNFEQDVVKASHEQPVLVDFWAPWCGPCQQLGPVLEELAGETSTWKLVKVNTDEHPEESQQYGIRGIPAVKLFIDGKVADEFTGALPRYQIEKWLEETLPSETKEKLAAARTALEAGNPEKAEPLLEELVAADTSNHEAHILLARAVMFKAPERALSLIKGHVTDAESRQTSENVKTLARLLNIQPEELPDEKGKDRYLEAIDALANQQFDKALERFIQVIQTNRYFDEDNSRKACLAIFMLLGPQHETTQKHRRQFDMALY